MSGWRVGLVRVGIIASVVCAPALVQADGMAIALSRLSTGNCAGTLGDGPLALRNPDGSAALRPDQAAFEQLAIALSQVVAAPMLEPVITSGPRGFDFAVETTIADLDRDADALRRGTEGDGPLTCDGRNDGVKPAMFGNRFRFSKGLPFGLSLGATLGRLHDVGLLLVGASVKLALLEEVLGGRVPDLAVRVTLTRALGQAELALYATTFDALLSKRFVVGERVALSPYTGAGMIWTRASTRTVDLTPNIDALSCQAGVDPVCNAGGVGASDADLAHDIRFETLSIVRPRAFAGLLTQYRFAALTIGASVDLGRVSGAPRPWTMHVAPSVSF